MKRNVLIILICVSFILAVSLVYSILGIQKLNKENNELLEEINHYEENIKKETITKADLEQEYENLKSNNNKLLEYEKWNKWTQEIEQKMS